MIDFGLLTSMILAVGVPSLFANRMGLGNRPEPIAGVEARSDSFLDLALLPALMGVIVGRLTTLAIDDPGSLGSIPDMLIIRSGVEFWPGLATATAIVAFGARRRFGSDAAIYLATILPPAMIGYGIFEACCIFRDGCFGPQSRVGLAPKGLTTTMFPVGIAMGVAVLASAWLIFLLSTRRSLQAPLSMSIGLFAIALVRTAGSYGLPHIGSGITRQHQTSLVVLALAVVSIGAQVLFSWRRSARVRHQDPIPN